jgi:nitrate reductase gamma subunit
MKRWLVVVLFLLCAAVSVPVAMWLDLSVERTIILAPVMVFGFAALVGLLLLWSRIVWDQLRTLRR